MSHRSVVQTKLNSLHIIKKAIEALGYSYYEGQDLVGSYTSNWSAEDRKADLIIGIDGRKDIGFKKDADGFFNLVGDFYQVSGGQKGLSDRILQTYNVEFVKDTIGNSSSHGITSYNTTTLKNGDIVIDCEIDESQIVNA
jgi:hypothetical protein